MQIAIDIDTVDYEYIKNGCIIPIKIDNHIYNAIRNGTPLTEPIYNIVIDEDKMMFLRNAITDEHLVIEKRLTESDDCVSRKAVKEQMIKYGFHAPDMTVTEFVEDILTSVQPKREKENEE